MPGADGGGASDASRNDAAASSDGSTATCADLAAGVAAALDKACASTDECAVTTIYNCCTVYTGIRKDKKSSFETLQAVHDKACPDMSGCGCQDHTEGGDPVPAQQPPQTIAARCDTGRCTAHAK